MQPLFIHRRSRQPTTEHTIHCLCLWTELQVVVVVAKGPIAPLLYLILETQHVIIGTKGARIGFIVATTVMVTFMPLMFEIAREGQVRILCDMCVFSLSRARVKSCRCWKQIELL